MSNIPQTRRCEECGQFFSVPMLREHHNYGAMLVVSARGPWQCAECRDPNRVIEERNPVVRPYVRQYAESTRRMPGTAATGDRK